MNSLPGSSTDSPRQSTRFSKIATLGTLAALFVAGGGLFLKVKSNADSEVAQLRATLDGLEKKNASSTRKHALLTELNVVMQSCETDGFDDDILKAQIEEITRQLTALELIDGSTDIDWDKSFEEAQDCLNSIKFRELSQSIERLDTDLKILQIKSLLVDLFKLCAKAGPNHSINKKQLQKLNKSLDAANDLVGMIESNHALTSEQKGAVAELRLLIENLRICLEPHEKPKTRPERKPSSHPRSRFGQYEQLGFNTFGPITPPSQKHSAIPLQQSAFHRRLMKV
ncbi:MAG: hypothetical protein WCT53_01820 [Candidatus Gracilibacteria bacterium]